jgi:NAD(P)-dependent dehydrogenase (short-subunit alcohol dehydrogenase family)
MIGLPLTCYLLSSYGHNMTHAKTARSSLRTWLITGATSGIGLALTRQALDAGEAVAALARDAKALHEFDGHPHLLKIDADVRDGRSVYSAVNDAVSRFGRIDVVANDAGYGLFGAVEEATDSQVRAVFDTNVFGALNVLRAVLPVLRAQRSGHIFQGSSLYGQSAHPGVGLLAATKYALEGLTDALVGEVAPLGIKVTLVQPGPTATAFLDNLDIAASHKDYDQTVREVLKTISALPTQAFADPARIAAGIRTALESSDPPLRLALGQISACDMRSALNARLADLDSWQDITATVDS